MTAQAGTLFTDASHAALRIVGLADLAALEARFPTKGWEVDIPAQVRARVHGKRWEVTAQPARFRFRSPRTAATAVVAAVHTAATALVYTAGPDTALQGFALAALLAWNTRITGSVTAILIESARTGVQGGAVAAKWGRVLWSNSVDTDNVMYPSQACSVAASKLRNASDRAPKQAADALRAVQSRWDRVLWVSGTLQRTASSLGSAAERMDAIAGAAPDGSQFTAAANLLRAEQSRVLAQSTEVARVAAHVAEMVDTVVAAAEFGAGPAWELAAQALKGDAAALSHAAQTGVKRSLHTLSALVDPLGVDGPTFQET